MPSDLHTEPRRVLRQPTFAMAARALHQGDPLSDPDLRALVEEARAEAYEQGRRDGAVEARADTGAVTAALERAAETVTRARAADAQRVVDLAVALAEHLVGQGIAQPALALAERARAALAHVDDEGLVLHCAPDDTAGVAEQLRDVAGLEVVPDAAVRPGEGIVRGGWAEVELTWEAAWDAVRAAVAP